MNRITREILERQVTNLNKLLPLEPRQFHISSQIGGHSLRLGIPYEADSDVFGTGHVTAREMHVLIRALVRGIELERNKL